MTVICTSLQQLECQRGGQTGGNACCPVTAAPIAAISDTGSRTGGHGWVSALNWFKALVHPIPILINQ